MIEYVCRSAHLALTTHHKTILGADVAEALRIMELTALCPEVDEMLKGWKHKWT